MASIYASATAALLAGLTFSGVEAACPFAAKAALRSNSGCPLAKRSDVAQTAKDTQSDIWDQIMANTESKGFMNTMKTGLKSSNITYLEQMGDYQNGDYYSDGSGHEKITHGIGGHAKVHFEWLKNEYSGMFQQADYCLARIANAAKPTKNFMLPASYNPNMALKCFRDDGMESASIQTIWEIDGYDVLPGGNGENKESCSYFDVPLSNHCGNRQNISMALKSSFVKSFQKVDDNSMWLGVSQMARATQKGEVVPTKDVKFPFALVFNPAPGMKDVPCNWNDVMSQLRGLEESFLGKTIYEVHAVRDPWADRSSAPDLQHIGNLVLDSEVTSSMMGDTELFFRHTFFEDELALLREQEAEAGGNRAAEWQAYASDEDMYRQEGAAWYMPYL